MCVCAHLDPPSTLKMMFLLVYDSDTCVIKFMVEKSVVWVKRSHWQTLVVKV